MYDNNNVFAKIVRGEIPCNKICENEHAISFYDINPIFEKHALVIPKGPYENIHDFTHNAPADAQVGFWQCFAQTADALGICENFNILANAGADAPFVKQSVFHFHLHLVAGKRLVNLEELISQQCK